MFTLFHFVVFLKDDDASSSAGGVSFMSEVRSDRNSPVFVICCVKIDVRFRKDVEVVPENIASVC